MKKVRLPIVALLVLGITGVIIASAWVSPSIRTVTLAWNSSSQDWEGINYYSYVWESELNQGYFLKPAPEYDLSGDELSWVQLWMDDGRGWSSQPFGERYFVGVGEEESINFWTIVGCDDPAPPADGEGWANLYLYEDTNDNQVLDANDQKIWETLIHGL